MQSNSDDFTFLVGNYEILEHMPQTPALPAFSDEMTGFLSALSRELLKDKRAKEFTDIVSYAYWIRRASLEAVKERHTDRADRIGRGVAFHIAPSNVPVNFAVSMTSSALAGNATLIRLSNKPFEQVEIICEAMNRLLDSEYACLKSYFCLIRYEHSDAITRDLSEMCDLRVIWGGNRTINTIRQAPLPPRAIEMAFADRHSIAVVDAEEYLQADAKEVAKGFYTDTYYTDQNACSSPRIVIWLGKHVKEARERFWQELGNLVRQDYKMQPIQAVDKFSSACMLGMGKGCGKLVSDDNYVVRVEVDKLTEDLMDYKNGGGYFFEYVADALDELVPILNKQCQTVSVLGVSKGEIKKVVFWYGVRGVDRIVPLGQTMGLEFIWDGFKMIEQMTRYVYG